MLRTRPWLPLALLLCAAALEAAEPSGHPGVRNAHSMAFDARRGLTLLFGGADARSVRADTWAWDGKAWRDLGLRGPSPRTFAALAWDEGRSEAVLFGGRRVLFGTEGAKATFLGDTWTLDENGWRPRQVPAPPPRAEAGMAFDPSRGVAVLFGGYNDDGGERTRLGDTWEWDGLAWHLRATTGPEPRNGVAMAYDDRLRRVVLFGGSGGPRADTWTWDGGKWQQVPTGATPGRFNSLAQFDWRRRQLVRTTGWNGTTRVRETWLFEDGRWSAVSADSGPSARNHAAMAYDRRRHRLVLYGGHDGTLVFGDTWEWDGRRWRRRHSVPPERRVGNGH